VKIISIVIPTYNEEENVELLYQKIRDIFIKDLIKYEYEYIFIDNASEDSTVQTLKSIARRDKNVKIIVNSRNFGHTRSPLYGLLEAKGDAVIAMAADFQDPPDVIPSLVKEWENGYHSVLAIKVDSEEKKSMWKIRELYYELLSLLSEIKLFKNFYGFGLYDRKVVAALKDMNDVNPFFRGMISEVGFDITQVEFSQPARARGITKHNFYTLYDMAMLGIVNNSRIPLRIATFMAIFIGIISFCIGIFYFLAKIIYWDSMSLGVAPLIIGGAFTFSILLFFMGIIGEYIGVIYIQVLKRPLVFEKERINFD
jgi:glycosyltransferase involved in cell wall biosynthesis